MVSVCLCNGSSKISNILIISNSAFSCLYVTYTNKSNIPHHKEHTRYKSLRKVLVLCVVSNLSQEIQEFFGVLYSTMPKLKQNYAYSLLLWTKKRLLRTRYSTFIDFASSIWSDLAAHGGCCMYSNSYLSKCFAQAFNSVTSGPISCH